MTFDFLHESLEKLFIDAMFNARDAHRLIFADKDPHERNHSSALAYIGTMTSKSYAAHSIYISNFDILEDSDIEKLIHLFKVYADEYIKSYSTDHSFQWVDIEYRRLTECFNQSPFSDNININFD